MSTPQTPRTFREASSEGLHPRHHRWHHAAAYAAWAHRHQIRKDGKTPYFAHTARVTLIISALFGHHDPDTLAAALLHDTIEDTTTDFDTLDDLFGPDVAAMVAALTKNMAMPEPTREPEYDARIAAADWRVRLIKLADAYDNLSDSASDPGRDKNLPKRLEAARRAIHLAQPDLSHHAETRTAIDLLTQLMDRNTPMKNADA